MTTPHPALLAVASELELQSEFPAAVLEETALLGDGRALIDDPHLQDLSHLPFVTIDGETSRDLDQAIHCETRPDGFRVLYAIADASAFAPAGGALFEEALLRGATYYLPGFAIPMLPRRLSEDLVSLGPGVDRRALVFRMDLDAAGKLLHTEISRSRIRSQAKLSFGGVQAFYDNPSESPIAASPAAESMRTLREVGEALLTLGQQRGSVRYRRREVEVTVAGKPHEFVVIEAKRDRVEAYNEQISILANREAGRLLAESQAPNLQPIYRVHPAPDEERLAALGALTSEVARLFELPVAEVVFDPSSSLAAYLDQLPEALRESRVGRALERQAIVVNLRSSFSTEAEAHFGVGAEVYARATAPMREIVGVFVHKELAELLDEQPPTDSGADLALRERVVLAANRARDLQRRVNQQVNRVVLDDLFASDLAEKHPPRRGTVMGLTASKVHVELDEPGVDVKLYVRDLGDQREGRWLEVSQHGGELYEQASKERVCRLGDEVRVRVARRDATRDRWVLELA